LPDTVLEFYGYAPGVADSLPKHVHEEYQFCFSVDFPGEYYLSSVTLGDFHETTPFQLTKNQGFNPV
jgi:hypothetical protein